MIQSKIRSAEYIANLPGIAETFDVLNQLGQGTFGSVFNVKYKTFGASESPQYALKMIVPTISIRRIENEVRILRRLGYYTIYLMFNCRGKHNVIRMHSAWRFRDHTFILMPSVCFIPFQEYYLSVSEAEIAHYLRSLLSALAYIHQYRIIHRDVKPNNFLIEPKSKRYMQFTRIKCDIKPYISFYLVDFGLAHSEAFGDIDDRWEAQCDAYDKAKEERSGAARGKNQMKRTLPTDAIKDESQYLAKSPRFDSWVPGSVNLGTRRAIPSFKVPDESTDRTATRSTCSSKHWLPTPATMESVAYPGCVCGLRLSHCQGCRELPRPPIGRRGGTVGFRPPEVIMRCVEQSVAVDVWAVGVIFLSFLTGRYPFIKAEYDLDVLHAFAHLLSYERMQAGAKSVGRYLLMEPKPPPALISGETPTKWLRARCIAIRRHERKLAVASSLPRVVPEPPNPTAGAAEKVVSLEQKAGTQSNSGGVGPNVALSAWHVFPTAAYDLLSKLLEPAPQRRLSAQAALRHPFLTGSTTARSIATPRRRPQVAHGASAAENSRQPLPMPTDKRKYLQRPQFC